MVMKCLECRPKFGTPNAKSLHYKLKFMDKIGECKCGDISLSGICLTKFIHEASNSNSNPNLRSCFPDPQRSFANSNSNSNCYSSSISNSNSNSNSNSTSSFKSNLRSGFADLQSSFADSNLRSSFPNSSSISKPGPIEIKIDWTHKVCNKGNVIKQINCFDKRKSICKECN